MSDVDTIATALEAQPDVLARLDRMQAAAWTSADPVLLELCRLRIAALLGCEAESRLRMSQAAAAGLDEGIIDELPQWPSSSHFGARERACLAFAEHFLIDVASMPDDVASEIARELGDDGARTFVTALLVVEQRIRLQLTFERLLPNSESA